MNTASIEDIAALLEHSIPSAAAIGEAVAKAVAKALDEREGLVRISAEMCQDIIPGMATDPAAWKKHLDRDAAELDALREVAEAARDVHLIGFLPGVERRQGAQERRLDQALAALDRATKP